MANQIVSVKGIPCLYCYKYKDGRRRYFIKTQCKNRIYTQTLKIKSGTSRTELKQIAIRVTRQVKNRIKGMGSLHKWIEEYIIVRQLKPKTANAYRKILSHYSFDIHHNAIQLAQSIKNGVNTPQIIRTVKAFFNWLNQNGFSVPNPAANVKIPNIRIRHRTLTEKEIAVYYEQLSQCDPELQLFGRLLLETGARVSSIYIIRLSDLTPDGLFLHNIKSDRAYPLGIPLSQATFQLWNKYVSTLPKGNPEIHIFRSKFSVLCRRLRSILDSNFNTSSSIERVVIHTLRHTTATLVLQKGIPIDMVSRMLDHSNIQTTMSIYAKPSPEQLNQAYMKLFEALKI